MVELYSRRIADFGRRIVRIETESIRDAIQRFNQREEILHEASHVAAAINRNIETDRTMQRADRARDIYLAHTRQGQIGFPRERTLVVFNRFIRRLPPKIGR